MPNGRSVRPRTCSHGGFVALAATSVATPDPATEPARTAGESLCDEGPGTLESDHTGEMEPGPVSPREREVLALLGQQLTHEEIGSPLFNSVRTVESHLASLRRKLGLPDHRAFVRYAAVHADDAGSGLLGTRPSA